MPQEPQFASSTSQPTPGTAAAPESLSSLTLKHHNTLTRSVSSNQLTAPSNAPHGTPQTQTNAGWTPPPPAAAAHDPAQTPIGHAQERSAFQQLLPTASLPSSAAGFTQPVGTAPTNSTLQPPTSQGSLRAHSGMDTCPSCDTCSQASGLGRARGPRGGHPDTTTAVLKARSDAAVLKDLKLGPLLGQGCFGRVYRGGHARLLAQLS